MFTSLKIRDQKPPLPALRWNVSWVSAFYFKFIHSTKIFFFFFFSDSAFQYERDEFKFMQFKFNLCWHWSPSEQIYSPHARCWVCVCVWWASVWPGRVYLWFTSYIRAGLCCWRPAEKRGIHVNLITRTSWIFHRSQAIRETDTERGSGTVYVHIYTCLYVHIYLL